MCLRFGHAAPASVDIAARQDDNAARGNARGAVGDGRARRGAPAGVWAARRCQRKIRRTICAFGARHRRLWTLRRGATVRAPSSHAARPEGDAREERDVAWRAASSHRRAGRPLAAPRVAGEQDVGRRRAATKRDVSGGESEERFANVERGACIFGHCGATQQCGPHRRTPQAWSEARASRGMWNGTRQDRNVAQGNLSRRRGRRVSKTWGDGGRRGIEAILHSWSRQCFLVISFAAPIDRWLIKLKKLRTKFALHFAQAKDTAIKLIP